MLVMGTDALAGCLGFALPRLLAQVEEGARIPQKEWARISDDAIRYATPVAFANRILTADATIGGCPLRSGERLVLSMLSANHDPAEFGPDADRIALRPRMDTGLAFGAGAHVCVGARMSRNIVRRAFVGLAALPALTAIGSLKQGEGTVVRTLISYPLRIGSGS